MLKYIVILLCLFGGTYKAQAQEVDTAVQRMNVIKLDLTSFFLYRNVIGLSFERVTKPNQTFAVSANYQEFPRTSKLGEQIAVRDDKKRKGYKFGAEYRFYLKKENRYPGPRGIYIGPYIAYHGFDNERTIEIDNKGMPEEAVLDSKIRILNIGFQLGYQFVLNNRWTIDIVFMGASISNYRLELELGGNYTFDKDDIQNEIILDIIDRFPLLDEAISESEATRSGKLDTWAIGYRYQLHIGYHFGRKK